MLEYKDRLINRLRSIERQLENCRNEDEELENEYEQLTNELNGGCEMKRYMIRNVNYSYNNNIITIKYLTETEFKTFAVECYSVDQIKLCISEFRNYMSSLGYEE